MNRSSILLDIRRSKKSEKEDLRKLVSLLVVFLVCFNIFLDSSHSQIFNADFDENRGIEKNIVEDNFIPQLVFHFYLTVPSFNRLDTKFWPHLELTFKENFSNLLKFYFCFKGQGMGPPRTSLVILA